MDEFVGAYFLGDFENQWQGQILGPLTESGNYWYVQTFSWVDGTDSTRHVVSVHSMTDWTFYRGPVGMRDNADSVRARWAKETEAWEKATKE